MKKRISLFHRPTFYGVKKIVIGVTGCDRGVGVTHFSFMLATYMKQHLNKSVAVLDFSDGIDFWNLYVECYPDSLPQEECFQINHIYFYPKTNRKTITNVLNENYNVIIIDFSTNMKKYLEEFLRCDEKYIVGSICDWKVKKLEKFIEDSKEYIGHKFWKYLIPYAQEKELTWLRKEYKVSTIAIPFNQNPFILLIPALKQLQKFL